MSGIFIGPGTASESAHEIDILLYILLGMAGFVVLLVFGLLILFSVRYRKGSSAPRGLLPRAISHEIELGWTSATLFLFIFIFAWAATTQVSALNQAPNAMEIHVQAKQWMWKVQQPNGAREINALHVPVNIPVHLIMVSQDVIHSFYVPALRMKHDVVPGRLNELWFTADKVGTYALRCAEYCGTNHSFMLGEVTVMQPDAYSRWAAAQPEGDNLAEEGQGLFVSLGCAGCHAAASRVHAPSLDNLYGRQVPLADGRFVTADEGYIRDSILQPRRDVVAGFQPIMPSFKGVVSEGQLQSLVAYIRSLGAEGASP